MQDAIRLGNWTVNAGLRWDHYQLLVNQNAVSPRLSVARYFPSLGLDSHVSYDRVFQTPSFENILLSSSPAVQSLNPSVLRLPVEPSHGNYYEVGLTKAFFEETAAGRQLFPPGREQLCRRRSDSRLPRSASPSPFKKPLSTGRRPRSRFRTGGASRALPVTPITVGNAWFPVTGGLLLGDDASEQRTAHRAFSRFAGPAEHLRTRVRYQLTSRLWIAVGSRLRQRLALLAGSITTRRAPPYGGIRPSGDQSAQFQSRPHASLSQQNFPIGADLYQRRETFATLAGRLSTT